MRHGWRFTTSYHTQFPQYLRARFPIPVVLSYRLLRWFHGAAARCMVSTAVACGASWRRAASTTWRVGAAAWTRSCSSRAARSFWHCRGPIAAYVGRVAVEKNIDAFLQMPWSGSKIVIGDGPERARLEAQYPRRMFAGFRFGEDLAAHLAAADVMVFPSRTDTFGLVNLEAMACGVPVAAYPVTGPIDVIDDGVTGALDKDLASAARRALALDPGACREHALRFGWESCTPRIRGQSRALPRPGSPSRPQRRAAAGPGEGLSRS